MEDKIVKKIKSENVGRWIGIKEGKIVTTSENHRDIYKVLKERNLSGVYVFYSPTEKEKRYGFLF
ncbi:hypothetical protein DRI96_00600 [Candidatus Aerophobetes bacterium]|uniref:DUF5678 domain-containing protein n=1 Tax=Aerophobetes bacterium TaxID=2030807 RepID=A0A662DLK3_UNCAE|nr:MAG: hypothetical protein DRI96_00600 [Candidatus Aerophobetes bacterium]